LEIAETQAVELATAFSRKIAPTNPRKPQKIGKAFDYTHKIVQKPRSWPRTQREESAVESTPSSPDCIADQRLEAAQTPLLAGKFRQLTAKMPVNTRLLQRIGLTTSCVEAPADILRPDSSHAAQRVSVHFLSLNIITLAK
jgi:hypothetical protein